MKKIAVIVALAGIASAALAQPGTATYIDVKGRIAGTTDWLDVVNFNSVDLSANVKVEIGVFYFRNAGFGLATVVHNVTTSNWNTAAGDTFAIVDRADSTQHPDGRQGNFNFGGQAQAGYTTGALDTGRLRIAAVNNPNDLAGGGISIKQNTPVALGAGFNQADGVLGYRFDITVFNPTPGANNARSLVSTAPTDRVNSYRMYATSTSSTATDILASLTAADPFTLNATWAPAPASLALLGMGGLVISRRRR